MECWPAIAVAGAPRPSAHPATPRRRRRSRQPRGRHLRAFSGCIHYAGARPAEVVSLVLVDCTLPDEGWGELVFAKSTARIGSAWTNTCESFDSRGLERRTRNTTCTVPIPPVLVRMLREHIKEFSTAPDG
ncbi:hypothetical protein AB0L26_01630 [Streptomyces nondiastaticus]|uniref:hypothetical protein n=1 Tax=Streptomyces nondiastaticus TaxID=3154512 RepID=UPI00341AC3E1